MKIIVLGADGYLGYPTVVDLKKDYDVIGVDSFLKRDILHDEKIHSIAEPQETAIHLDITDYQAVEHVIKTHQPDVIINYAELPSAPYSMETREKGMQTIFNNISGNMNIIYAIRDHSPKTHLIKLGTLGEYGTPNIDIEEGYLEVTHNGRSDRLLYPKNPFSIYHLSKVHDSDALAFACRVWGLRVTDLNQGFVWGHESNDVRPRFTYDGVFGTALNRFIVQAVTGHPLTVYGKGNQTRGILNLRDTLKCIRLAIENPAEEGEFRVFNQFTESWSINQIAKLIYETGNDLGIDVKINHIDNPRKEKEDHYYNVKNDALMNLGLEPHYLTRDDIEDMLAYVITHKDSIQEGQIMPKVKW